MAKNKNLVKLFPRDDFVERVNALSEGLPSDYISVLLEVANQTELDYFLENSDLNALLEKSLSTKETTLGKLRQIWRDWCLLTSQHWRITFRVLAGGSESSAVPNLQPNADDVLGSALKDYFDAIESEDKMRQRVREIGYKYIPTWPTLYFIDQIPEIKNELGYDPFADLENYAASIDQAIPQRPANVENISVSQIVKDQLIAANLLIAARFAVAWNDANKELVEKFEAVENPYGTRGVANLGRLIVLANLHALVQTVDHSFLRKYQKQILDSIKFIELTEPVGVDDASENAEELNETMQLMGSLTQMFEEYESLGVSNDVAKELGLAYINLLLMAMFCDAANHEEILGDVEILKQLPIVSPFITSGLREAFAEMLVEESYEDEATVGDEWHVIAFSHQKDIESNHLLTKGLCEIFDRLNFLRWGISKSTFLEMSKQFLFANEEGLDDHECAQEFFCASQNLISWLYTKSENDAIPTAIDSLEMLVYFGDCDEVLYARNKYDLNPVWALSRVLLDDSELAHNQRNASASRSISVSEVLLDKGLIAGAACVFNFTMVSEALRMVAESNHVDGDRYVIRYLEPFGDWPTFKSVVSRLMKSGKRDSVAKAVRFATDCFRQSGIKQFGLVIDELTAYVGGSDEVPDSKGTAEVIRLVQSKGSSIRERLISLIGEDAWNCLPSKVRGQVIQCEQVYDQSMGDQVLSDEPNYAWLTWYNTMIERMFKLKLSPMWSDPALSRDIDTSYATAVRKAVVAPKFSLGSALYVCNGAVESGNREVLSFLKHRGVDIHFIVSNISKELLKAIRIRNKGTHAEDISHAEASEARRIFLTKLPDIVQSLGITDQDY